MELVNTTMTLKNMSAYARLVSKATDTNVWNAIDHALTKTFATPMLLVCTTRITENQCVFVIRAMKVMATLVICPQNVKAIATVG